MKKTKLHKARRAAGLLQQDLADVANRSRAAISYAEKHGPSVKLAQAVAGVLGVQWYELIEQEGAQDDTD